MAQNEIVQFEQKEVALINKLVEFKKQQEKMDVLEKELKANLKDAMEKYGIKQFKNDVITITYVDESESTSIDLSALKKNETQLYNELLADYPKVTKKNAYVRFTVK
jgi:hypothetical protein